MKMFLQILLLIIVVPAVLVGIISATFKYALLEPQFWETTYEKYDVYSGLTNILKKSIINQTISDGGRSTDVSSLTDLLTNSNIKVFFNKNLENILGYINGNTRQLLVYIPIDLVPSGLLPAKLSNLSQTMTINSFIEKLNIQQSVQNQINSLYNTGKWANYVLIGDIILLLIIIFAFYILVEKGSRMIIPGLAFILSGLLVIVIYYLSHLIVGQVISTLLNASPAEALVGTLAPSIILSISRMWFLGGVILLIFGVIVMFLKKPGLSS